jgi:hypothetical protein
MYSTTSAATRGLSVVLFLLFLSTMLTAQVKIKERVTISPVQVPLLKSESGGDFIVQFQFDGELNPASAAEIFVNNEESSCYNVTWGDFQATAPLITGDYLAVLYFYPITPGTLTYSCSANGQELLSNTISISDVPNFMIIPNGFSFFESFKFDHDSVVISPDIWENVNVGGDGENCQANVQWSPSYLTTWTVVQGSEWGQLIDGDGNPVGATYTARVADIQGLSFKFAPNVPNNVFCIIEASSGGIVRYKKIYPLYYANPELVVNPPTDINQYIAGTDLPKMPNPVITAQLKNYNGGEVDFNWELTIKWQANGINFSTPQDTTEKYKGTASGQNSDVVDLEVGQTLYGETDMRGGDQISLTVTCTTKVDGKIYTTNPTPTQNPFVIKGENPNPSTLLSELGGDNYAAIAWKESRFNQFSTAASFIAHPNSTAHEYPLYNTSYDFGLMQINHPDYYPTWLYKEGWDEYDSYFCDDIVWNWVTNVQQGKLMLNHLLNLAKSFNKNYKNAPQLDSDQQWKQAYCGYHAGEGHYYWKWVLGDAENNQHGDWKEGYKDGTNGGRTYANDAWDIYNKKPWPKK